MEKMDDLEEFRQWLIDDQRFSPGTVSQTVRKLTYIFSHSRQPLAPDALQDFIRSVWEKKGNKTANQYIKIANRWLKFKGIGQMKYFREYGSEFTVQICSPEEKAALLETAARKGPREKAMFYLLFGTGVRLGEACDLKVQDVREDTIRVRGKGQKVREVFLPAEAGDAIRDYIQHYRTAPTSREDLPFVFTTKAGRRMSYDYFRKLCQDVAFAAAVKFHPHMARHTYATDLLKAGVSVVYVSQLLGHEDLESTSIYLHPSQYDAIQMARSVDLFCRPRPQGKEEHKDRPENAKYESDGNCTVWTGGEQNVRSRWNPEDLQEKIFLLAYVDSLMQHPLTSRVGINATPSLESNQHGSGSFFLSPINATPRENKCNTINATPVRWTP
jgi:integrase